jgi:hypothetical protein
MLTELDDAYETAFRESGKKREPNAVVSDPSGLSLNIVELNGYRRPEKGLRYRTWRRSRKMAIEDIREDLDKVGISKNGMTIIFDRLVSVASDVGSGELQRMALAPQVGQQVVKDIFRERTASHNALQDTGLICEDGHDANWSSNLVIAHGYDDSDRFEEITNDVVNRYIQNHGPFAVDYLPLEPFNDGSSQLFA